MATGEHVQNRVIFKQLFQAEAIDVCQIDACRVAGVNEVLAILLLAAKFGIPVCPHAGGVGLCEYVQHLAVFDFVSVSGSLENRVVEWVDHLHEHFRDPAVVENGRYRVPRAPGYSIEMLPSSLAEYAFPDGPAWADDRGARRREMARWLSRPDGARRASAPAADPRYRLLQAALLGPPRRPGADPADPRRRRQPDDARSSSRAATSATSSRRRR